MAENNVVTNNNGTIYKVSGPLVIAKDMPGTKMFELVHVGHDNMIGEIIQIDGNSVFIQVYEGTSGLRVGDPVKNTGKPLSVELGPGLLDAVFDGTQRPLMRIHDIFKKHYVPVGVNLPALDREKLWPYVPSSSLKVGDLITGGDIFGTVYESEIFPEHNIMLPPNLSGKITFMAPAGNYTIEEKLLEIEYLGKAIPCSMYQIWPVRQPRPILKKVQGSEPLLTGQRVLDSLFPSVKGGTCAIPGAFGCGKTCISHALAKYSNTNVTIYVGCGERGNEIAEVLKEFPHLKTNVNGKMVPIMGRTCLVANTSNMPVAAREASIYTGITIAEYFRDMGYHACMMADSTSRWAEALREISGRLAEMPADSGYPAYLSSRLSAFYERAGVVQCLGSSDRTGSVTIVGAISPPGGDFSDPVTAATMSIVHVFWGLDKKLAQRKHFPSVNWSTSFTKYDKQLESYFEETNQRFMQLVKGIKTILQKESELSEIVQLVGRDSLSEDQKLCLEVAKIIREDFLQQNSFTDYDYKCPLYKTFGMMNTIVTFYNESLKIITETNKKGQTVGWGTIYNSMRKSINKITRLKFIDPDTPEEEFATIFKELDDEITNGLRSLVDM
ncbi:vacuolar ATP synthase catalytic subunit A, putative [Theileria equi strain WA]|uniref:H(+)-transporting two-sector ATPase n=1 Tax=Theileria equi strain WA TaxID=1537102 RepID=L0B2V6_THEEQ|nr:vacuolar ATP synthase catalytic subunit A, putative [Theileria equi strain WA]AFZ81556.1 vacuolar ATP synthase catalytic subunit A, putative [Theileria equi strain WA]|eukprot:XP_004831222.1 vacuolar ATP synthase catalytic subunit A, putative [Theileria equi strain WA]